MLEKIELLFKELKEKYNLKQIPKSVVEKHLDKFFDALIGAVTYVTGSPYVIENNDIDLDELNAKDELTEDETKKKIAIEQNKKDVIAKTDEQKKNIEYFLAMIEGIKVLNK